ncbi:MAG TPA: hypothetical protein EYG92_02120 [Lutibacter sp.]|nr:hypothetical protein [Lutibacter sp.]
MKIFIKTTILIVLISLITSCKKDVVDPAVDCSTSSSRDIEGFFGILHSSTSYELYETMDLLTHEYTFTTANDLQICGFGYKSQNSALVYTIELEGGGSTLYSSTLSFDNSAYEYISVPPITVTAGTYTLRRTLPAGTSFSDVIGPITRGAGSTDPTFPISLGGGISIDSANFYGSGGPVPNYGVPNIYFEYIEL